MEGGILGMCPCLRRPAAVDRDTDGRSRLCISAAENRLTFTTSEQNKDRVQNLRLAPLIWDPPEKVILMFLTAACRFLDSRKNELSSEIQMGGLVPPRGEQRDDRFNGWLQSLRF